MTTAELAYRASSDGMEDRNDLVLQELPQVYYLASRIHERMPKSVELDDLVQAGVIGLIEACRSFDSAKDAQFSTFAKFRIRGAILDSLRKLDWGSRTLRKKGRDIAASISKLESTLGRPPQEDEIAAELQMDLEKLQSTMTQLDGLCLIGQQVSTPRGTSDHFDLIESAPAADDENPFEMCLKGERKAHLAEAISRMSEREQLILSLYYKEELTMKEVAQVVGIAVSRVSQIHAAAMVKLRSALSHMDPKAQEKTPRRESWTCDFKLQNESRW